MLPRRIFPLFGIVACLVVFGEPQQNAGLGRLVLAHEPGTHFRSTPAGQ